MLEEGGRAADLAGARDLRDRRGAEQRARPEDARGVPPAVRAASQTASQGRGEDVNNALGHAGPLAEAGGRLLRVIAQERESLRRLIQDGGFVLDAGRRAGRASCRR